MSWSISAAPAAPARGAGPRRINVIGLGPAGAILALRAAQRGWQVHGYDPGSRPDAAGADAWPAWPATYGAFAPEVPAWADELFSPAEAIRVTPTPGSTKQLGFRYRMMAKDALRAGAAEAVRYAGGSLHAEAMTEEQFADLPGLTVDCRGAATGGALWQIAVGYVLRPVPGSGATLSEALITPTLMDWTASPTAEPGGAKPSFLYVQRLPEGWLAEETILASTTRPTDADFALLRARLEARLASLQGEGWREELEVVDEELVAIPMGTTAAGSGVLAFGARDGFIHPATGYSVGTALQEVDGFLDRVEAKYARATHSGAKLTGTARRANVTLARALRRIGSLLVAEAETADVQNFFAAFFSLPTADQLAYLSGRSGLRTARTMWRLRKNTGWTHPVLLPLYRRPWRYLRFGLQRD
ncbi:lycopene cyclase family protein [uncultured Corynebacterium sp.]|uniref:lycopene cyclase family protein n=1 Tax=uncultured Corynebacterium sp. TaxID=159447 RepID=UPI00288A81A0|nr:lycopene cyclase family protein [uncultured Corynebacterium sp.]